jgi:predicted kinase
LVIVSGLPGSGKTTVAKQLAQERPGVRLCPDDWMVALGIDLRDSDFRGRVEQLQETFLAELLRCGATAIVSWGTWAQGERRRLQQIAEQFGAPTELILLDPPLEVLWGRVVKRGFGVQPLRREDLEHFYSRFQRPDDAEAATYESFTCVDH